MSVSEKANESQTVSVVVVDVVVVVVVVVVVDVLPTLHGPHTFHLRLVLPPGVISYLYNIPMAELSARLLISQLPHDFNCASLGHKHFASSAESLQGGPHQTFIS